MLSIGPTPLQPYQLPSIDAGTFVECNPRSMRESSRRSLFGLYESVWWPRTDIEQCDGHQSGSEIKCNKLIRRGHVPN